MPTDSDSRKLERIEAALSNLEISADSVNLNTDGLEAKLDTANGILTTLSADTALVKDDIANGVSSRLEGWDIPLHDYRSFGYTGSNITTITYKTGGSGGTTVATITLAYDGNGNLTSMTKS